MVNALPAPPEPVARKTEWRNTMPPIWTDNNLPHDVEDSEEPAIRARRIMEGEAKRVAADCGRLPEMRMELVREMRARIASGEYRVSPGDLADAIIRTAQRSRLYR
jgi:anti-sigma28 factor (negative regulator of flagellin synthesis)